MPYTYEDALFAGVANPGIWVKLVDVSTGLQSYVAPAKSAEGTGRFALTGIVVPGRYSLFTMKAVAQPLASDAGWADSGRVVTVGPYDDVSSQLALDSAVVHKTDILDESSLALSSFVPADYALKAWTFDPVMWQSSFVLTPAGTLFWQRIHVRKQITVTQLVLFINAAGVGLVANQCYGLLYGPTPGFAQIAFTGEQSTNWQSTGYKAMTFSGGPFTLAPADYFTAVYYNGTTGPGFGRGGGSNIINGVSTVAVSRFGTANTGATNAAPGALQGMVPFNAAIWAALA